MSPQHSERSEFWRAVLRVWRSESGADIRGACAEAEGVGRKEKSDVDMVEDTEGRVENEAKGFDWENAGLVA